MSGCVVAGGGEWVVEVERNRRKTDISTPATYGIFTPFSCSFHVLFMLFSCPFHAYLSTRAVLGVTRREDDHPATAGGGATADGDVD